MEKLTALLLSMAFCGTVFASSSVTLSVSNGGDIVPGNGTVEISLSPLYSNIPYKVTCDVHSGAIGNTLTMGVVYPLVAGVKTIFALNNVQFVHTVNIVDAISTFAAFNVENTSPENEVITLVNLDDADHIGVDNCVAVPVIGFTAAK